ncbi:MAG: hypothetical protein RR945_04110 [Erysipelotrichaceae bacterium]
MKKIIRKVLVLTFCLVIFVGLVSPVSAKINNRFDVDRTEES